MLKARWVAVFRDGTIVRGITDAGQEVLFKSVLPRVQRGELVSLGWEPLPQTAVDALRARGIEAVPNAITPKIVNIPPSAKEALPYQDVELVLSAAPDVIAQQGKPRIVAYCVSVDGVEVLRIPA